MHTQLQECCSSNVKCVCGVTFSVLITVDTLPGKSSGRAGTEGEKHRVPKDRALSFLPHSASPLLEFSPLFSNKPSVSLLLTCLFVCVTSIHNNIITRLCLKPLSSSRSLSSLSLLCLVCSGWQARLCQRRGEEAEGKQKEGKMWRGGGNC